MDKVEIGFVIARQRKEKSLTQKALADMLKVSNKTISKWETGEGFPDITILPALAEVLSITVDELLGGSPIKDRDHSGNNAIECAEYLASKTILRFKNACVLSNALSIFGVVAYWVL
ncbi:helix-turn-helix transcriptional regulator [Clostridium sp. KNHs216]|uniref:helix-turn-helix domain-containing protein n=1 Tax=Clostridium sp. KNHs216 TaxID=1550235 RepID=UPI0011717B30|nr:helix-turn-helix transcriptional regulator [Clostridium sp. KNHs216]TQI67321.1 helix-turn-helix protein [Clostridium sp. KNHs216]